MSSRGAFEVRDLRHFSAAPLRALLHDEAERWERRLRWDYRESTDLLLDYLNNRSLTGYAAVEGRRVLGYAFGVAEANKAVVGDLYAFGESESSSNPICDSLLTHLLETLQHIPGIDRVESQLLMFPADALCRPFRERGFRSVPRLFMTAELPRGTGVTASSAHPVPAGYRLEAWHPGAYDEAARLIHQAYDGHVDAGVNDQYCSVSGAARFLHNIVRFPGCGLFDASHSSLLRHERSGALAALLLCSRVRHDVGHITQLCVAPGERGRGLGRALLRRCKLALAQNGLRALSLTVTEANTAAVNLYESESFRSAHRFEAWVWG